MSEPNLINRGTLLGFLLGLMLGTGATAGVWVLLRARGEDATNREAPKVEPPAAHVEADRRKLDKADREDRIRKLEQLAESLRAEIAAAEKQIELLSRAHTVVEGENNAKRLAQLQMRYTECEKDLSRLRGEVNKLEAERKQLLRESEEPAEPNPATVAQVVAKNSAVITAKTAIDAKKAEISKAKDAGVLGGDPRLVKLMIELEKLQTAFNSATKIAEGDAVNSARAVEATQRKLRLEKIDFLVMGKREEQNAMKEKSDNLRKMIDQFVADVIDVKAMRDSLKPQQDMLEKVNAELVKLRIEARLEQ